MKKWLYSLLALVLLTAASCTKTTNEIVPNTTIIVDVLSSDWKFDTNTKTYFISITTPEINNNSNQSHGILVAMSRDQTLYEALPEVFNNTSFTYIYQPGTVLIEAQSVNGAAIQLPTTNLRFKITIIPANTTN